MSETAMTITKPPEHESVHLVARTPQEMASSQVHLAAWLDKKVASVLMEIDELREAFETAQRHKWASKTLRSHLYKAEGRLKFYNKLHDAVVAGYTIIPDFPGQVFAIRVKREKPTYDCQTTTSEYRQPETSDQKSQLLPSGEGEYKSPVTEDKRWTEKGKDANGKEAITKYVMATEFREIDFPLIAAIPDVMNATQQALALRIFDEVAISPSYRRKVDPIIIGRILAPTVGYSQKSVNFLIAWHLDLRAL